MPEPGSTTGRFSVPRTLRYPPPQQPDLQSCGSRRTVTIADLPNGIGNVCGRNGAFSQAGGTKPSHTEHGLTLK